MAKSPPAKKDACGPDARWFAKPKKVAQRDPATTALRADFDATHERGLRALKEHDFNALGEVIEHEAKLIRQQMERIEEQRATQNRPRKK